MNLSVLWVEEPSLLKKNTTAQQLRVMGDVLSKYNCHLINPENTENIADNPIVLTVLKIHNFSNLELMSEKYKGLIGDSEKIIIYDSISSVEIKNIINSMSPLRLVQSETSFDTISNHILDGIAKVQTKKTRSFLVKQFKQQIKELETLNESLQEIVNERTQHIEQSKIEEESKTAKIRNLIKFIKEISYLNSHEEILKTLRKEFKKFPQIGDPIFIYQIPKIETHVYSFVGGQVHHKVISDFESLENITQFSLETHLSKSLADAMRRPYMPILVLPIHLNLISSLTELPAKAFIGFECSFKNIENTDLLEALKDRINPLSIVIDRILLESELIKYSYRWEQTFDGLKNPIAIIDKDYEILRSNKKFNSYPEGKKCYAVFAQRDQPCEGCILNQAIDNKSPQSGSIKLGNRILEMQSYPILFESGRPTNVVNQYIDKTQSRELYLKMLQNEKIGALGFLAGNIAHELNNPLTGLRSLAQIISAELPADSQVKNDLEEIERAAARSQGIIKNLLDFSQGISQAQTLICIDDIVEKTLPFLKTKIRLHRLHLNLNSKSYRVMAEPNLLQQVVFNLINNACQAMPLAGNLHISTEYIADKKIVSLVVQDSGTGIPDAIKEKIFEPFFTTKQEGVGTGLGLSLAKKIITSHAGQIFVESEVGKGSQFIVHLPAAQVKI